MLRQIRSLNLTLPCRGVEVFDDVEEIAQEGRTEGRRDRLFARSTSGRAVKRRRRDGQTHLRMELHSVQRSIFVVQGHDLRLPLADNLFSPSGDSQGLRQRGGIDDQAIVLDRIEDVRHAIEETPPTARITSGADPADLTMLRSNSLDDLYFGSSVDGVRASSGPSLYAPFHRRQSRDLVHPSTARRSGFGPRVPRSTSSARKSRWRDVVSQDPGRGRYSRCEEGQR